MKNPVILPGNDEDADNRLIQIVITYITEREMPIGFAIQYLEIHLKNKSLIECSNFHNQLKSLSNEVT